MKMSDQMESIYLISSLYISNLRSIYNYSSSHPYHTKKTIPFSLAIRKERLNSTPSAAETDNQRFQEVLLTQFHPKLTKAKQILYSNFHILQSDPDTRSVFRTKPRLVFQHPPNLKNLVRTNPSSPSLQTGAHTCKRPRYRSCSIFITSPQSLPILLMAGTS